MKINQIIESRDLCAVCGQTPCNCTHVTEELNEFVTPQAVAGDPGLEREKDVDVIIFGRMPQEFRAEDVWAALEEVLPREYPPGTEKAQLKTAEISQDGGAIVTNKPLSVAKKLVATFNTYGIKSRINEGLNEFAPGGGGDSGDYLRALASAWYNGTFDSGSLQKGIKSQEDVERLLNRGIVCPDGKTRKLHIDYNSDFDGVEIYSDDYYEHGDLDGNDGRTGQPWGPYDHMEFKDEELDEGVTEGLDPYRLERLDPQTRRVLTRMTKHAEPGSWLSAAESYAMQLGLEQKNENPRAWEQEVQYFVDLYRQYSGQGVAEGERGRGRPTAGTWDPTVGKTGRVEKTATGIRHHADPSRYGGTEPDDEDDRLLSKAQIHRLDKATEPEVDEGNKKSDPPEADYGADYQDMVARVKKLAGLGPLKTVWDEKKRVYKNVPVAVQPKKEQR